MTAKCKKCNRDIICPIVGTDEQKAFALGQQLLDHFEKYHISFMKQLSNDTKCFSGFVLMNQFLIDDEKTTDNVEEMRERLATLIMEDGPMTDAECKLEAIADIINGTDEEEGDEEIPDEDKEGADKLINSIENNKIVEIENKVEVG